MVDDAAEAISRELAGARALVAARLVFFRERAGLTVRQAALTARVSAATLSALERGASSPLYETLIKLAIAYDIDKLFLLADDRIGPVDDLVVRSEALSAAERRSAAAAIGPRNPSGLPHPRATEIARGPRKRGPTPPKTRRARR